MTDTERLDWLEKNCGLSITRYKKRGQDGVYFEIETHDGCFDLDARTLRDAIDAAIDQQANTKLSRQGGADDE